MIKPKISDFDSTEQQLELYNNQLENYNKAIKDQTEFNAKYNKNLNKNATIISIVSFVVCITIQIVETSINGDKLSVLGIIIFCIICIAPIMIIFDKEGEIHLSDLILLVFPFIGLFISIQSSYEKKGVNVDKSKYINEEIESKILDYKNALEKYKDLTDKSRISYWEQLTPSQFEKEVANLYSRLGYAAKVTKTSGDGGIDIIITRNQEKIGIQCKHHSRPVGPAPVRELMGVIGSQDFVYGIFVSLNGFTKTVHSETLNSNIRIQLLSGKDLCKLAEHN